MNDLEQVLKMIIEKVDSMQGMIDNLIERQGGLEKRIEDEILNPIREGVEEENYAVFQDRYGDKLNKLSEDAKAIEGEDYDFTRDVYENSRDIEPEDMDSFIDEISSSIAEQIADLKRRLGVPADSEVQVTSDENGTDITVDGQPIEEAAGAENAEQPEPTGEEKVGEVSAEDAEALKEVADEAGVTEESNDEEDAYEIAKREQQKDDAKNSARAARRDEILKNIKR